MPSALALALLLFAAPASAGDRLTGSGVGLKRNAQTCAGELATSAGLTLNNAVAENAVSSFTGGGFKLYSGLMHLAAVPGTVTSIAAVSKSTGTLELSWTAPGLDGFAGNVASGFYRLDTSSDPLHAFDPTVFTVEFATDVAPGDPQSYRLTGLIANTTYYTRIYLVDGRKVVADTSSVSDESTLSLPPVSPVLTGVFSSSVTFSWTLPAPAAAGFRIDSSSTGFIGGAVISSRSNAGATLTLAVTGLAPATTYSFRLGSLNWQSELSFDTVIATRTRLGGPRAVAGLGLAADDRGRRVTLTWTVIAYDNPAGTVVQVSTLPISALLADGIAYAPGDRLADGSVIRSTSAATSHVETALALDTTEYFRLYTADISRAYSVEVSTQIVLDLPPMAPVGLGATPSADGSSITIRWSSVLSNMDGSSFRNPAAPGGWELKGYDIYRATGIVQANWVLVGTAPPAATAFLDALPGPQRYFYKVAAADGFRPAYDAAMAVDTQQNLYVVAPDRVSRLKIPASLTGIVRAAGNRFGRDLLLRASEQPTDLGGRVVKSLRFDAAQAPTNEPAAGLQFPDGQIEVNLRYETARGLVLPSAAAAEGLGPQAEGLSPQAVPLSPVILAAEASQRLAAYWYNGRDYVKLYGRVDPAEQTVAVQSAMPGGYQIRSVLREAAFDFDRSGTFNKAITPNGDGLNDAAVFVFDNPKDSAVTGRVYDLRGGFISDMRPGPVANSLQWDGKAAGRVVSRGVYLYQIQGEGRTFSGTVMVVR